MNNTFIYLPLAKIKKLKSENVEFCAFEHDGKKGIVLDAENLIKSLTILNLHESKRTQTTIDGIDVIEVEERVAITAPIVPAPASVQKPEHKVIIGDWNGASEEKFQKITEEILLPVIDKNIIISVP